MRAASERGRGERARGLVFEGERGFFPPPLYREIRAMEAGDLEPVLRRLRRRAVLVRWLFGGAVLLAALFGVLLVTTGQGGLLSFWSLVLGAGSLLSYGRVLRRRIRDLEDLDRARRGGSAVAPG